MKKIGILELRPTQFVLGMKEVEFKYKKFTSMGKKELDDYFNEHPIPVVIGPKGETYLIDHHHQARVCWEAKLDSYVLKTVKDLSDLSVSDFWNYMIRNEWTYLYDQFGMGPHSPYHLPMDIRSLADDPYRSLAWVLREDGFIAKVDTPFFEFKWAAFFRFNLNLALHSKSDFKDVTKEAQKLAKSKLAAHLPGYK